jgi:sulfite reductase beta subunit-like hemoprotein
VSKNNRRARVALKYCGSCNPRVDLSRIARHLAKVAEEHGDFELIPLSENDIDVVVILCGCPRACGDKDEVRSRAKHNLVVCGEAVSRVAVPENELPLTVEKELIEILSSRALSDSV